MRVLGKNSVEGKQQLTNPAICTLALPFPHIDVTTVLSPTLVQIKTFPGHCCNKELQNDEGTVINSGREQHDAPFLLAVRTNC